MQLLQPVAERWPGPVDDAASFFMAAAYWNGFGVPRDLVRAWAAVETPIAVREDQPGT